MILSLILVAILKGLVPINIPKSFGDCPAESTVIDTSISEEYLYEAVRYGTGQFIYLRAHSISPGQLDTFIVDDSAPGYTYKRVIVDHALNMSCPVYNTVGVPTTSVEYNYQYIIEKKIKLYSVTGAKVKPPYSSGVYFSRELGRLIIMSGKVILIK